MALKRMVLQIGMGTDIRGADYTKAAVRALRDALWHNGLSVADAVGLPVDAMQVEVTPACRNPIRSTRKQSGGSAAWDGNGAELKAGWSPPRAGHQQDGHRQRRRSRAAPDSRGRTTVKESASSSRWAAATICTRRLPRPRGRAVEDAITQLADFHPDARRPADNAGRGHDWCAAAEKVDAAREGCAAPWPSHRERNQRRSGHPR